MSDLGRDETPAFGLIPDWWSRTRPRNVTPKIGSGATDYAT
jgi:hypothetical protein